ncbi:MAG: hypothetical protein M0Z61_15690 [Nitrospiraceae bacterium]|nr:hypothetical protein [Nitrospiraceae bacterium]
MKETKKTKKTFLFGVMSLIFACVLFSGGQALAAGNTGCNCQMGQMGMDNDMMTGAGCPGCMGDNMGGMKGGMMMHRGYGAMHGEVQEGMMMGGLSDMEMMPMLRHKFMKAMMKTMIRNTLQDPEIKKFLDSTATLRKDLVMKQFDYFEAFRNPATTPDQLEKMKADIRDLKMKIRQQMISKKPMMQ